MISQNVRMIDRWLRRILWAEDEAVLKLVESNIVQSGAQFCGGAINAPLAGW